MHFEFLANLKAFGHCNILWVLISIREIVTEQSGEKVSI